MFWRYSAVHNFAGLKFAWLECVRFYCYFAAAQVGSKEEDGAMWMQMAERSSTPGGPWRMGGLGFGLPLSRLYARYFGAFFQNPGRLAFVDKWAAAYCH